MLCVFQERRAYLYLQTFIVQYYGEIRRSQASVSNLDARDVQERGLESISDAQLLHGVAVRPMLHSQAVHGKVYGLD